MQTENGNEIPTFTTPGLKYIRSNIDDASNQDKLDMYNTFKPLISVTTEDLVKLSPFRIRICRVKGVDE